MCMCVFCVHTNAGVWRTRKDTGFPGAEGTGDWQPIFTERTLVSPERAASVLNNCAISAVLLFACEKGSLPGLEPCQLSQAG